MARCPNGWAVYDEGEGRIVYQGPEPETYFLSLIRRWLADPPLQMSYLEMRVRSGEIKCTMCGAAIRLAEYNHKAPETRQICRRCKGG